jgi:uncharacterized RDD family membrane protein YckC
MGDLRGHYAGFASRAVAIIVDSLIITAALTIGAWVMGATVSLLQSAFSTSSQTFSVEPLAFAAFVPLVFWLYMAGFWALVGKTPGKALMGLKVVGLDGSRINFPRSLLRCAAYAVSMILFLGFLWVLIDDRRMGWHDKIARTCVVYDWEAQSLALVPPAGESPNRSGATDAA